MSVYEELMKSGIDVNVGYSLVLNNYALLKYHSGDRDMAQKLNLRSISIREKMSKDGSIASLGYLAMSYLNYARFIFEAFTSFAMAEEYILKAIDIYTDLSKRDIKHINDCLIAKFYYGKMLSSIDVKKALILHKEVLEGRRNLSRSNMEAMKSDIASSYFEIGKLMLRINNSSEARHNFEEAYKIQKELFEKSPEKYYEEFESTKSFLC